MAGSNPTNTPIEAAAEEIREEATEAFSLLGNETRVAILLALWEAYDPFAGGTWDPTEESAVSFSQLRDRVGIRQGAQFNYHLDKLVGRFVRKTDSGYELLPAGTKIVRTIIGIAGFDATAFERSELDLHCPLCGASTEITYRNQRLFRVCTACDGYFASSDRYPSGILEAALATPVGFRDRSPESIYNAIRTQIYQQYALRIAGICPECTGRVATRLHVCEAHEPSSDEGCPACGRRYDPAVRFVCTVCKHWNETSVVEISMRHPAVAAFCWEHGIELGYSSRETARWLANIMENADQQLVSTAPPRVRVTVRHEGDELRLTLDEKLDVVEVGDSG